MHILISIILIVGAFAALVLGLVSVVRDLLDRGPHGTPRVYEDCAWPVRYRGSECRETAARAQVPLPRAARPGVAKPEAASAGGTRSALG